jgi:sec-independent protein translocase protein TatA
MRFGGLGAPELLLIALVLVLVFGASKLGDIGGALGKSVNEFKKATRDSDTEEAPAPPAAEVTAVSPSPAPVVPIRDPRPVVPEYRPSPPEPSAVAQPKPPQAL